MEESKRKFFVWKKVKVFSSPKQFRFHLQLYAWFNSQMSVSVGVKDWPKSSDPLFAYLDLLSHIHEKHAQIAQ